MKKVLVMVLTVCTVLMMSACGGTTTTKDESKLEGLDSKMGSYYQIFVRSFADSNNDGIGDFKGIADNVDYIADLGFEGIWLMPMMQSDTYHGYDVKDYYAVEEDYGTMEDFQDMIEKCHEKGIKVIIDFVLNHTSSQNEWFKKACAGDATYEKYYVWANSGDARIKKSPEYWGKAGSKFYYCYFSGTMPDLNYNSPLVWDELGKVGNFWIDKGIDGFRLDGILHIFGESEGPNGENTTQAISRLEMLNTTWTDYAATTYNKELYVVGEVYDESASLTVDYFKSIDSTFDFWLAKKMLNTLKANGSLNYASDIEKQYAKYEAAASEGSLGLTAINAPFLTNHDQDRVATILDTPAQVRFAAEMLLTLEGNTFVYYGEELGMKGVSSEGIDGYYDETRRLPFVWGTDNDYQTKWIADTFNTDVKSVADQKDDADSLYNTYKALLNLRKDNIALKYGKFEAFDAGSTSFASFTRTYTEGDYKTQVLVVHALSEKSEMENIQQYLDKGAEVLYYTDGTFNGTMGSKTTLILNLDGLK